MARTKKGNRDLEAEVIDRCVRAIRLEGRCDHGYWHRRVSDSKDQVEWVLRYLAARFGVTL